MEKKKKRRISKTCRCGCGEIVSRSTASFVKGHWSLEYRFWNKVSKKGENECWDWIGSICSELPGCERGVLSYKGKHIVAPPIHVVGFVKKRYSQRVVRSS